MGRDFTNWIKGRIDQYGFVAGTDYTRVENLSSPKRASAKFRQQIEHDYLLSLDMAKEVAMVERNEQGRAVRRYFIQCEEALQLMRRKSPRSIAGISKPALVLPTSSSRCAALDAARAEQERDASPALQQ